MLAYLQRKWQSLVFRLLLYFLLAAIALAIVLGISFAKRVKPHVENEILPNVERYIEYLIDDIGLPPNLATAGRLASELPFELRIEGQGVDWSSSPALAPIDDHDFEPAPPPYDKVYISHHRRAEYLLIDKGEYRYLFAVDTGFRRGQERRHGFLLVALGLVFFGLYLAIRRMFKPIGAMSQQVRRIGEGELEQTLDLPGQSELSLLADGINRMSARIRSMLEGKSALLLAISHELRSPMTRMRVNLELLDDSETRQKLIEDLREMEQLVATILESEKLEHGHAPLQREPRDLPELLEDIVAGHACAERIDCRFEPLRASVDPMRFSLLAKNLVDNACRYSDARDGNIVLRLRREAGDFVFEVEDHGPGIDETQISRLSEPFYRPDGARSRDRGGYGLGLYLCRLIAAAHGGSLDIESGLGSGTRVSVRLPLDNS